MTDQKQILRTEALRNLARIDSGSEDPSEACRLFFEALKPQKSQIIAAYWPLNREFDVHPVIDRLLAEGLTCVLPIIRKDKLELSFIRWSEDGVLKKNHKNVNEPVMNQNEPLLEPDIIITPLLAFDRKGYRLGRGGGYYDATLQALRSRKHVTAVGMAWSQQAVLFNLPTEEHDQKLDWVITPQAAHYFGD